MSCYSGQRQRQRVVEKQSIYGKVQKIGGYLVNTYDTYCCRCEIETGRGNISRMPKGLTGAERSFY